MSCFTKTGSAFTQARISSFMKKTRPISKHILPPIGLYFLDGAHDYANQYRILVLADPFLAPGALILVDDTNFEAPRQATLDFLRARSEYQPVEYPNKQ